MKLNMNLNFKLFLILKLIELSAAIILNCREVHENLGTNGILSCVVDKNFTVLNDDENLSGISGIKSDVTIIRGFAAENKEIHYIPQNISANLPELKNFMIKNSSLKEVTSRNLREFPELIYLDLSYNHIKVLDKDVFQHNHQLSDIQLNNNHIFAIESGAFDNLKSAKGMLKILNMNDNDCQFSDAKNRKQVINLLKTIDEKCWNQTSIIKYDIYKNQGKLEKIERQLLSLDDNIKKTNKNISSLINLQNDINENNETYFESLYHLNETLNERIKRSIAEVNESVSQSNSEINEKLDNINNRQSEVLQSVNDILDLKKEVIELDNKLDEMMKNSINIFEQIKTGHNSTPIFYSTTNDSSLNLSLIPTEHLNTILLIIIIVFQLISCCSKLCPKPKINKFKSRFHTAPPSLEPVYYTTATQIIDDYPKESQRLQKYYESYDDIQSYNYMSTSEKKNDSNEVITTFQAEVVEHQWFSNEIYSSVTASNEDLYSEVISPMRMEGKGELNDESAIYAVVEKRKEGD